ATTQTLFTPPARTMRPSHGCGSNFSFIISVVSFRVSSRELRSRSRQTSYFSRHTNDGSTRHVSDEKRSRLTTENISEARDNLQSTPCTPEIFSRMADSSPVHHIH